MPQPQSQRALVIKFAVLSPSLVEDLPSGDEYVMCLRLTQRNYLTKLGFWVDTRTELGYD